MPTRVQTGCVKGKAHRLIARVVGAVGRQHQPRSAGIRVPGRVVDKDSDRANILNRFGPVAGLVSPVGGADLDREQLPAIHPVAVGEFETGHLGAGWGHVGGAGDLRRVTERLEIVGQDPGFEAVAVLEKGRAEFEEVARDTEVAIGEIDGAAIDGGDLRNGS